MTTLSIHPISIICLPLSHPSSLIMYLTELANHCIAVSDDLDFDIISALIRDELDIPVPFSNDDSILLVCCLENLYASFDCVINVECLDSSMDLRLVGVMV